MIIGMKDEIHNEWELGFKGISMEWKLNVFWLNDV